MALTPEQIKQMDAITGLGSTNTPVKQTPQRVSTAVTKNVSAPAKTVSKPVTKTPVKATPKPQSRVQTALKNNVSAPKKQTKPTIASTSPTGSSRGYATQLASNKYRVGTGEYNAARNKYYNQYLRANKKKGTTLQEKLQNAYGTPSKEMQAKANAWADKQMKNEKYMLNVRYQKAKAAEYKAKQQRQAQAKSKAQSNTPGVIQTAKNVAKATVDTGKKVAKATKDWGDNYAASWQQITANKDWASDYNNREKYTKENKDFLKAHGEADIPSYEEIGNALKSGEINQAQAKQLSNARLYLDTAQAHKEARDVEVRNNIEIGLNTALGAATFGTGGIAAQGGRAGLKALASNPATRQAAKNLIKFGKTGAGKLLGNTANMGITGAGDGAVFGAIDYGTKKATGTLEEGETLAKDVGQTAALGGLMGGAMPVAGRLIGLAGKTAPAKAIKSVHADIVNSDTGFGNWLAKTEGTLADTMNVDVSSPVLNKYKDLNRIISEGSVPLKNRLTPEQEQLLTKFDDKNLKEKEQDDLFNILRTEDTVNPAFTDAVRNEFTPSNIYNQPDNVLYPIETLNTAPVQNPYEHLPLDIQAKLKELDDFDGRLDILEREYGNTPEAMQAIQGERIYAANERAKILQQAEIEQQVQQVAQQPIEQPVQVPEQAPARTPVNLEQPQDLVSLVNNSQGNKPKAIAEPLSPVKETPKVNIPKEDLSHVPAQSDMPVETVKAEPTKVVEEAPKSPQQIQKEKYQKFNDKRNGVSDKTVDEQEVKPDTSVNNPQKAVAAVQKAKYAAFNERMEGVNKNQLKKWDEEPLKSQGQDKTEAQKYIDDYLRADKNTRANMIAQKFEEFNGDKNKLKKFLEDLQTESERIPDIAEEVPVNKTQEEWDKLDKLESGDNSSRTLTGFDSAENMIRRQKELKKRRSVFLNTTKRLNKYLKEEGIDLNKTTKEEIIARKKQNAEAKNSHYKSVTENKNAQNAELENEVNRIYEARIKTGNKQSKDWIRRNLLKERKRKQEALEKSYKELPHHDLRPYSLRTKAEHYNGQEKVYIPETAESYGSTRTGMKDPNPIKKIGRPRKIAEEVYPEPAIKIEKILRDRAKEQTIGKDPEWWNSKDPMLNSMDNGEVSKSIQDVTKTRFAKASRDFSHKVNDFADEIASEDKNVAKVIKEYIGDDNYFYFDNLSKSHHGHTTDNGFVVNQNDPLPRQLETGKHESHHLIMKEIAEACGEGSREYKLYNKALEANKKLVDFATKNRESIPKWRKYKELLETDENKAYDYLDTLDIDDYEKVTNFDNLYDNYKYNIVEEEARNAQKGEWTFFGKDIKEYEEILRVHRGRTQRVRENTFAEYKKNAQRSARQIPEGTQGSSENAVRSSSDDGRHGNPNSSNRRLNDIDEPINQSKDEIEKSYNKVLVGDYNKTYRNLQNDIEKKKVELGLITEEQRKARLQQQGGGTYIKEISHNTGDSLLDTAKDYNALRENKVGIFGKKSAKIPKRQQTAKERLIERMEDKMNVDYTYNVTSFVEKEFGKPVTDGKVKEGYVGINKKIFTDAIYSKKSRQWFEQMSKGDEDVISKAYDVAAVKDYWLKYAKENSNFDYQIPKAVYSKLFDGAGETAAEYWKRYAATHPMKALARGAAAVLDYANTRFKQGVLNSSSFILNNRFGNQIMIAENASSPIEYLKSFAGIGKLKDSDLPSELVESSVLEAIDDFNKYHRYSGVQAVDNFLNLFNGKYIDTSKLSLGKKIAAGTANVCLGFPSRLYTKMTNGIMKVNSALENMERRQLYYMQANEFRHTKNAKALKALDNKSKEKIKRTAQNMVTTQEAVKYLNENPWMRETTIRRIEDILGDYNNFNKFEKSVLKRVVPFYSWHRTIARHTLKLAQKHPVRLALTMKELHDMEERDDNIKAYQSGSLRTGITDSRSGKRLIINKVRQIPYNTLKEWNIEGAKSSIAPGIKVPVEMAKGEHLFNNSEITSRKYFRKTRNIGQKDVTGYVNRDTGEFEEGGLPWSARAGYGLKEAGKTLFPMFQSPLAAPEKTVQGIYHKVKEGDYLEPDKLYDADLGGYYAGDKFDSKNKRWATQDTSQNTKLLNRVFGLSLQNEQKLSKAELKEKARRQKEKYKRFKEKQNNR